MNIITRIVSAIFAMAFFLNVSGCASVLDSAPTDSKEINDTLDTDVKTDASDDDSDSEVESDTKIDETIDSNDSETSADSGDTDVSTRLTPPDLSPGYVDITPAEVKASPAWGTPSQGQFFDYPALIMDLDGNCVPQLNSVDCNGWVCKRPAACKFEAVFTTQRTQNNQVIESGLVYSYDRVSAELQRDPQMSSLSRMGVMQDMGSRPEAYMSGVQLFHDDMRERVYYGELREQDDAGNWRRANLFDPGPCGPSGVPLLGFGDYDRDGWLDILQPATKHVEEVMTTTPVTVNVICDQGPVVLQTQTPEHRWEWHDAFPRTGNNNYDFHDTYAFVNVAGGAGGAFQVLAMGRPRPNGIIGGPSGGTASGFWVESGLDNEGFPVAAQQDFVDANFATKHPMGGDQLYYFNPSAATSPWRSLVFSTTVTSHITAGESYGGTWYDSGPSTGILFPTPPPGSSSNSGPWGAIQVDPDKNGVPDLLINSLNDSLNTVGATPYLAAWWSPQQDISGWAPFREWSQGQLGDINTIRGGRGGRSLAAFDIDSDGDLDIVDVGTEAPPRLLRNDIAGNSISISLTGQTSNVMGIGSMIEVEWPNGFKLRHSVGGAWNPSIGLVPNYEFGLGPYTEARVTVTWHSGAVIDYGTLQYDATSGAINAYVLVEPTIVAFSDADRLMTRGQSQVVSVCPRTASQQVDAQATIRLSLENYSGAQASIGMPVKMASGCWEATLRAGSSPGSARINIQVTQNAVTKTLNVHPRIWVDINPGYSD